LPPSLTKYASSALLLANCVIQCSDWDALGEQ
jgi:hypothetical protein